MACTDIDPLDRLRQFVAKYPTQRDAAYALDVSQAYLSDILNQHRPISPSVLTKLGLRRAIVALRRSA